MIKTAAQILAEIGREEPDRINLATRRSQTGKHAPCGTDSAYKRHLRYGEPADEACREAHAVASAKTRERRQGRKP